MAAPDKGAWLPYGASRCQRMRMPDSRFRALRAWTWYGHRPNPAQSITSHHRPDRRALENIKSEETLTTTPLMLIIDQELSARRRVVDINRNSWSTSTETGGRHQLKHVVDINRNSWSASTETGGRHQRNTQNKALRAITSENSLQDMIN